jgi:hypothetical protein
MRDGLCRNTGRNQPRLGFIHLSLPDLRNDDDRIFVRATRLCFSEVRASRYYWLRFMTTIYTLRERDAQRLIEKLNWRPLACTHPEMEAKRKEWVRSYEMARHYVCLVGKPKRCLVYDKLDPYEQYTRIPALQRASEASAAPFVRL